MANKLVPTICWQTLDCLNIEQITQLVQAGFKGMRIFIDLCDLPYTSLTINSTSKEWQDYINHIFVSDIMPDGLHAWRQEGRPNIFGASKYMRDAFIMCQKLHWLPVVCMGMREEGPNEGYEYNWLSTNRFNRAPKNEHFAWLGKFAYEFGFYLKYRMSFQRADLEIWNEPSKMQGLGFGWDDYVNLSLIMGKQWKKLGINFKLHVFADDILNSEYSNNIISHVELRNLADYISVHIGVAREDSEWDDNLLWELNHRLEELNLKIQIAVTEMAVNGIWSRLDQLVKANHVTMYGLILAIRKKEFGTALRIDDIWLIHEDGSVELTSQPKKDILIAFNNLHGMEAEIIMEYLRPDELQAVYDALGIKTPYNANTPNLFVAGKKDPAITVKWADIDALEETRMKALISGLKKIGVLPVNFPNYPNIKYDSLGNYLTNWQNYAKSKPKI